MPSAHGMFCSVLAVGLSMALGCGPTTVCAGACAEQALHVIVPPAEIGQVMDVLPSDVACAGVAASCTLADDAGACEDYRVAPIAKGNCHVDVDLASGTRFSADVMIVQTTGCCAGLYADPISAATIEVP